MPHKAPGPFAVLVAALTAFVVVPGSMSALSAGTTEPETTALHYLSKSTQDFGVTRADVDDMVVTSQYRSPHSGVTHVNLNQQHEDLEVFGGHATVNVGTDGNVVFAGGSLVRGLGDAAGDAKIEPTEAVEAAAEGLKLDEPTDLRVIEQAGGPSRETLMSGGGISDAPIPATLGWQPTASGLRKAWELVIDDSSDVHLWRVAIDAETARVLDVDDWTIQDPHEDLAGTLTRSSAASSASTPASPNPVADGSSYRVFSIPTESPNDGSRSLVTNPADGLASPFGWHDTNAAAGAEFTIGRGNNAHAYLDQDGNNAADFGEADAGPALAFDFPAELNEHAQNYREAAVTNLFYWNNIVHDVMYRYGFTESAGNFQANNYGRGGTQGDYVRAEAADGAGTNNANFSTPVETATSGGTPRMQMFLWPGNQFGAQNQVVVEGVGSFDSSWSRFGAAPRVAGTTGQIVNAGNGCAAADYAAAPAGAWMAIVTGSNTGCQNVVKARTAEAAGANAVVVAHTTTAAAPILTGALTTAGPTIPVASIGLNDGNAIRAAAAAGATTATVRKHPSHPGIRDGDLENGIIIHEYGHGISNRLTGGPAVNCLNNTEQAGEGWSDYFAILMLLNPALDDPNAPRGMGPYALFQDGRQGAGIRPRPYSRNMEIQPFTYDSIKTAGWLNGASLAIPHGLGHGWAAVLWDMAWDLIDKHGFNPNIYEAWDTGGNNRALQYVVDGLKLQGCSPGLVTSSRAIVAATEALGAEDTCTVWAAFARRGLGYSAVQGSSGNRDDGSEAFDTHPSCRAAFVGKASDPSKLNAVHLGSTVGLNFTLGGFRGLDILAGDPYSRQVDCKTLRVVSADPPRITPRALPVPTETPGNAGLSYDAGSDTYTYPWQTRGDWDATCRELVLTRNDGVQHRAFFRFVSGPAFTVAGTVRDTDGTAIANATVAMPGAPFSPTTTDDAGRYSLADVPKGTYEATASAGGCNAPQTQTVDVSKPTTLDFTLPAKSDSFGYSCRLSATAPFEEAATPLTMTGCGTTGCDDVATTITLPFQFTLYGTSYAQARVCTNGFVEFIGPTTTNCSFSNVAIPATGRPNGAVYGFWDDLFVDHAQASVRTETKGTSPNRRFVVEWRNVQFFSDPTRRVDFNIVLHENGQIVTQYRNIADDAREKGGAATLGIENATGTVALRYSFNEATLASGGVVTSIRYRPPTQ